jgi:hypothetical protein
MREYATIRQASVIPHVQYSRVAKLPRLLGDEDVIESAAIPERLTVTTAAIVE